MNLELCIEIQEALHKSNQQHTGFRLWCCVDTFVTEAFSVSDQLAEYYLSEEERELLPEFAIEMEQRTQSILSTLSDKLPDHIRYLLCRLLRNTADELSELLDKYDVQQERVKSCQVRIEEYVNDLLRGFVSDHEQT